MISPIPSAQGFCSSLPLAGRDMLVHRRFSGAAQACVDSYFGLHFR